MTERSADRQPSISSSTTDAEVYDESEKNGGIGSTGGSFVKLKSPDELEIGDDVERAELLPEEQEKPPPKAPESTMRSSVIWMVVNTFATIGIVSRKSPVAKS